MTSDRKKHTDRVRTGLEVLLENSGFELRGKRFGLLAHAASVTSDLRYAWDALMEHARPEVLFGPEHGLMGTHQDQEGVVPERSEQFDGIPVHSLYGTDPDSLRPPPEVLQGLDVLLVDLQDVGSRYYTYLYTLAFCMEACRNTGVEVWVLDRPNPLGGLQMEGNLPDPGFRSFVGWYSLPVRHGMTIGECAKLMNEHFRISCRLRVVPMQGWRRGMWFDETGLPWVMPSPNMPTLDTAIVYPGGCLLEGTNLSEGRGTTSPFEILGAPWIDPGEFVRMLEGLGLPGVVFRPLRFRPTFQKHAGQECGGVQLHVCDRNRFQPFLTGVQLIRSVARLWPGEFEWRREPYEFESRRPAIDLLAGGTWLRDVVESGGDLSEIRSGWAGEIQKFKEIRSGCLLYS